MKHWKQTVAALAAVPMMAALTPSALAVEDGQALAAQAALESAVASSATGINASGKPTQAVASDAGSQAVPSDLAVYTDAAKLLASFDFDAVRAGESGTLADATGAATATVNGVAAVASNDLDGSTALTLGANDWLSVTKADGSALLAGRHAVTISYDSRANQDSAGWAVFAAPSTVKQEYQQEHYLGFMDQTKTLTVERYNCAGKRVGAANVSAASHAGWKHVDLVVTNEFTALYVDGELKDVSTDVTNQTLPQILGEGGGILQVGKANWVNGEYFTGSIDNLRVYDATAAAVADAMGALTLPETATADFTVPTASNGEDIAWTSNGEAITIDDAGTAHVTRPASDGDDAHVTLTASCAGHTVTFDVTVPREETDGEKARADLEALSIPNMHDVRSSITLPAEGAAFGTPIQWTSSDPNVVSDHDIDGIAAGVVVRPEDGDRTVVLTATAGEGDARVSRSFVVTVRQTVEREITTDYLFAHFTGTEGAATDEQMYFATSADGLSWNDLHSNGNPALTSTLGEQGVRDPYLVRSPEGDRTYLIATDLSIYHRGGWGGHNPASNGDGSLGLVVWETTDMVHWSEPRLVDVASRIPAARMAWAPEAYWIPELGQYMVYWATTSDQDDQNASSSDPTNMYYALTRDFVTFSEPVKWIDRPQSVIDTTMIQADDGYYYRVSGDVQLGVERTKNPTAVTVVADGDGYNHGDDDARWEFVGYFRDLVGNAKWTGSKLEGPELFRYNDDDVLVSGGKEMKYGLMWDQYAEGKGYLPFYSADLGSSDTSDWASASKVNFGSLKKRHGTILPITASEREAIEAAYADDRTPETAAPETGVRSVHVLDASGKPVSAATMGAGASESFDVVASDGGASDGASASAVTVTSDDESVATATFVPENASAGDDASDGAASGILTGTLTVTGVKAGTATVTVSYGTAAATLAVTVAGDPEPTPGPDPEPGPVDPDQPTDPDQPGKGDGDGKGDGASDGGASGKTDASASGKPARRPGLSRTGVAVLGVGGAMTALAFVGVSLTLWRRRHV